MTSISVLPVPLDFQLYVGDGVAVQFDFVNKSTGLPFPLTGTWEAQIRNGGMLVTSWLIDTTNAATGTLKLSLSSTQTRLLAGLTCTWDLQQTPSGADPRTWHWGTIRTNDDVTHP